MENRFSRIRAFAFDVDGVLTDGGILADLNGELYRTFDSKDGMAIRMAVMKGYHMAIITGGRSESIRMRFGVLLTFLNKGIKRANHLLFIITQTTRIIVNDVL